MAVDFPQHPFWDFSLEVYGSPGVPDACLRLQEAHGIDVNVILFCCWVGRTGRGRLGAEETAATCRAVAEWHEVVVRGVRAVRQRLKGGMPPAPTALSEPLRRRLAALEVQFEHVEQLMLAEAVDRTSEEARPTPDRLDDALANIGGYFEAVGVAPSADDAANVALVLAPAFPGTSEEAVREAAAGLVP